MADRIGDVSSMLIARVWFKKVVNPCKECGEKPRLKKKEAYYDSNENFALFCKCDKPPLTTEIESHECGVCKGFGLVSDPDKAWENLVSRLLCLENRWNEMNPSESVWDKLTGVYTEAPAAAPFLEGLS